MSKHVNLIVDAHNGENTIMNTTTVRRNTKFAERILSTASAMRCYSLDTNFSGEAVPVERVRPIIESYWLCGQHGHGTLRTNGFGAFTLRVHSNLWFEFTSVVMAD